MAKKKANFNKPNSSGWLDNYSEEFSFNKYPEGGEVNPYLQEAETFLNDYYNSPRYKEMVSNSTIGDLEKPANYFTENRINNLKNRPPLVFMTKDKGNLGGTSNAETGEIKIYPRDYDNMSTYLHELVHSSDRPLNKKDLKENIRVIPNKDIELINKLVFPDLKSKMSPESYGKYSDKEKEEKEKYYKKNIKNYIATPEEVRARLLEIRKAGKDNNIFDPFTQKVDYPEYKKLLESEINRLNKDDKGNYPLLDLIEGFDNDGIIQMLNEISQNQENDSLPMAKNGGEIYNDMKKNITKYPEGGKVKKPINKQPKVLPEVVITREKNKTKDENDWMDYMAMAGMGAQLAGAGASSTGVGVLAGGPLALAGYAMGVPDAVRDTYNSYNEGNYGDAALSATGLIPGFNLMKDLGMFTKGARFVNKAENFNKAINALNIIDRAKEEAEKNKSKRDLGGTSKYPAGGYLNYQEGYKGFGVGPELYQDNSYFRSVMPDNIENMEEQINKPSIFSGINNVLSSVNQGVNQVTGLMSKFQNPQTGYEGLTDDAKKMFDYNKLLNFAEGKSGSNFFDTDLSSITDRISGGMSGDGQVFGGLGGGGGSKGILQGLSFINKNGGYLKKYQNGGDMDMLPVGAPEYIHKSNVFNEQYNPVPRVHFSDDTTAYDMGVNLNDLVNMNGGRIRQYAGGGFAEMYGNSYGGASSSPRLFNANTGRATLGELQAATQNDFLNTKVRKDRQKFVDNKVDWGFMNWAKEPVGAYLGMMSTVPIVGDITKDIVGDSFLTRTSGYQVGQGLGKTTAGAGKIIGGIATGNVGMVGSGIGDVGSGVGGAVGNLNAESAMSGYNKSGYVSGKRMANAAQDFGNMMNTASSLYGNIEGGVNMANNMGGMNDIMGKLKGGQTGMKGFGNIMGNLTGFRGQDGGYIDENMFMIEEYKNGGVAKKVNNKNKQVTGWLDQL